ncbi:Pre-mRNA-processing factor 39 [Paragonimus skrjabini miyazakii]|uniref:Pre-mRNA-processing factor 39 n=1 Tax=Paragonimus skrjabini miyazakii TaxID=59628 RepID=A0A8S9YBE2_9TREM|nr:Pre-mRNA-processing factor 39 [Paragonimus skrjabini miyazakii]
MCAARTSQSFSKLWRKAHDNPTEFTAWTTLLDLVEKQQNIDHARKAFESFFQHFPYCYGYWKKWAEMEKRKGDKERSLEVYMAGVKAIPLSVDLWTAYLDAAMECYHGHEEYETKMRSLYEEALDAAGLEFRSDALWEHYISWESGHNRLVNVVDIYTRMLQTPTQLYFQNWDSFNKLIEDNRPEDILSRSEFARLHAQVSVTTAVQQTEDIDDDLEPPIVGVTKPVVEITDAVRSSIRELLIASRERIYQTTYNQIMKRWYFEEKIRRPYFHVKPLEEVQLTNWAEYLSFEEAEATAVIAATREEMKTEDPNLSDADLDAAVGASEVCKLARRRVRVLYERCLIPCALYEHFWIRYAKYLEITELDIPAAREVWRRACTIHLRYKPTIHWHWGCFEELYPSDLDSPPTYPVRTCLEILTELEERLTDSALVCCRRADAMRRAKKPLFDIIACLRSGINRLRYLSEEQTKLAKSLSGPTASRTVAQAIATSAQARAGAGVLAGRLARLLHRDESFADGVPVWMLLLHTVHKEDEEDKPEDNLVTELESGTMQEPVKSEKLDVEGENEDLGSQKAESVNGALTDEPMESDKEELDADESEVPVKDEGEGAHSSSDESMEEDVSSDENADEVSEKDEDDQTSEVEAVADASGSPPAVAGSKRKSEESTKGKHKEKKRKQLKTEYEEENTEVDEAELTRIREEERLQKEKELAAAEEERIRAILDKRQRLIRLQAPADETLTDEDRVVLNGEQAAICVLKEAVEYDPRNERLYAQLLDIVYQRRPVDIEGFIEMCDFASIDSILPAAVKLAFCQRKIQFLEEFDTDVSRLRVAYHEYLGLCEAVNSGVAAAAAARGSTRFTTGYPLPDLLNLPSASARMTAVAAAGSGDTLVTAGPVARLPCLNPDQAVLEAAASVGTPAPDPSTSAGYYTAGAYEPLAAALGNVTGLPPAVPTNLSMMNAALAMVDPSAWAASADPYASYYYGAVAGGGSAGLPVAVDYPHGTVPTSAASGAGPATS